MKTYSAEAVVLDVGHGNCTIVREEGTCVIVDAAQGAKVVDFLLRESIRTIDLIIVSHADADHISGIQAIVSADEFDVKSVYVSTDAQKGSRLWDDLVWSLENKRRTGNFNFEVGLSIRKVTSVSFKDVDLEVVAPSPYLASKGAGSVDRDGKSITSNSISACIRVSYRSNPVLLLTGDLDEVGLNAMDTSNQNIKAEVLVFPHHGGGHGSKDDRHFVHRLLNLVQPKRVLFSMGRDKLANPRKEIVAAIKCFSADIRVACTQLSANCFPRTRDSELGQLLEQTKHHRLLKSCAGDVRILLSNPLARTEHDKLHHDFVSVHVTDAICRK